MPQPSSIFLRLFHPLPAGSDRPEPNELRREAHAREAQNTAPPFASRKISYRPETRFPPLAVTPFGHLGPLEPWSDPTKTLLQEFGHVVDYRLYRLDDTSILISENDSGRNGKCVKRCQVIRPTMKTFDGSSPITLLSFLKDISITFNAQRLNEGVAVQVVAHFLERDAERLYTSYTMTALRSGSIRSSGSNPWPRLVNLVIHRYLTDDVLNDAYESVATIRQLPHENKNVYADRLEDLAYACTAVFSDAALVNYFIGGLAVETRDVVAETVYRLPFGEQNNLAAVCRIALAEGNTYRARSGKALPDIGANAQRTPRVRPPWAPSSSGSTLYLTGHEAPSNLVPGNPGLLDAPPGAQFDPVMIMPGRAVAESTSSDTFNTARSVEDPTSTTEVDITKRIERFIPSHFPALTEEHVKLAQKIVPPNSPYHRCCLCRIVGHTLYTCPFLTEEQKLYSAYRNYEYQLET